MCLWQTWILNILVVQSTALSDSHSPSAFSNLPHLAHLLFHFLIFSTSQACTAGPILFFFCTATEVLSKVGESFARGEERTVIAGKTLQHSVLSFLFCFSILCCSNFFGVYKKKCILIRVIKRSVKKELMLCEPTG